MTSRCTTNTLVTIQIYHKIHKWWFCLFNGILDVKNNAFVINCEVDHKIKWIFGIQNK